MLLILLVSQTGVAFSARDVDILPAAPLRQHKNLLDRGYTAYSLEVSFPSPNDGKVLIDCQDRDENLLYKNILNKPSGKLVELAIGKGSGGFNCWISGSRPEEEACMVATHYHRTTCKVNGEYVVMEIRPWATRDFTVPGSFYVSGTFADGGVPAVDITCHNKRREKVLSKNFKNRSGEIGSFKMAFSGEEPKCSVIIPGDYFSRCSVTTETHVRRCSFGGKELTLMLFPNPITRTVAAVLLGAPLPTYTQPSFLTKTKQRGHSPRNGNSHDNFEWDTLVSN